MSSKSSSFLFVLIPEKDKKTLYQQLCPESQGWIWLARCESQGPLNQLAEGWLTLIGQSGSCALSQALHWLPRIIMKWKEEFPPKDGMLDRKTKTKQTKKTHQSLHLSVWRFGLNTTGWPEPHGNIVSTQTIIQQMLQGTCLQASRCCPSWRCLFW